VKVWIYKGPFQDIYASARDTARLRREAALAAGETVGRGAEERARRARENAAAPAPAPADPEAPAEETAAVTPATSVSAVAGADAPAPTGAKE